MNDIATQFAQLQEARPQAARLALLTCLPVRVAPQFLRMVRLTMEGDSNTGDEADLWLSGLVESRSAAGFSFRRDARDWLRTQLANDAALLDLLWQRVHCPYAKWLTPRARMEEALAWRLLRERADPAIDAIWRNVVDEMRRETSAAGLARWVVRVQADLPDGSMDHDAGRLAHYAAHLVLGDASVLGQQAQQFVASGELHFATRGLARRRVFVGLAGDGLLIQPDVPFAHGHPIDLPATRPLWLQLEDRLSVQPPVVVTFDGARPLFQSLGMDGVTLRAIDGAAYRMHASVERQSLRRNRRPRVQIEYDVELADEQKTVRLPFMVGVMADLGATPAAWSSGPDERNFLPVDADSFDDFLAALHPSLSLTIADRGDRSVVIDLDFRSMADFTPQSLVERDHTLRETQAVRDAIVPLLDFTANKALAPQLRAIGNNRQLLDALTDRQVDFLGTVHRYMGAAFFERFESAFEELEPVARARLALALRVYADVTDKSEIVANSFRSQIEQLLALTDDKLFFAINQILHHPAFQRLESAWRGLHYLVSHTESDDDLHIRVMPVSREELATACAVPDGGSSDQSALYRQLYEEIFGTFGAQPYGCLVADFYFSDNADDIALLSQLAAIAAAAHAPLITGAAAALVRTPPRHMSAQSAVSQSVTASTGSRAWDRLRGADAARYLYLAGPRFMARDLYGSKNDGGRSTPLPDDASSDGARPPALPTGFEEEVAADKEHGFVWANAAYAMAAVVTRAFARYGWCGAIEGPADSGVLYGLPTHTTGDSSTGRTVIGPLETASVQQRLRDNGAALAGVAVLTAVRGNEGATFLRINSMYKPSAVGESSAPSLHSQDGLASHLNYMLAASRFMLYIKCMVRDKIGSFASPTQLESFLQRWISQYSSGDIENSSNEQQARFPLGATDVRVSAGPGTGPSTIELVIHPHFQLPDPNVPVRLVTQAVIGMWDIA